MNLFNRPENKIEETAEVSTEKSPAELIAESLKVALQPLSDAIEAQNARFNTLEQQTKREPKPEVRQGEPTSVLDDENLAFAQRLTPILARQFEMESQIVRDRILREYSGSGYADFVTQYEGEINQILDAAPLATNEGKPFRGDPQYIRNVIDMVYGRLARKGGVKLDGKSKGFFLESAHGSDHQGTPNELEGVTENQRRVAERMGIPLTEIKKAAGKLHFVN